MYFSIVSTIFIVSLPIFTHGVPVSIGQQDSAIVGRNERASASTKLTIIKAAHPTGEHIVVVKDIKHLDEVMKLVPATMHKSLSKLAIIKGFAGKFTPEILDKFLSNPNVERVSQDGYMDYDSVSVQSNAPWNLVRLNIKGPILQSTPTEYKYDATAGSCADVYVIDSGINIHHDEFKHGAATRAHWGATFGEYPAGTENTDQDGHGTAMAGIIAGTTHGVAKLANVYAVKIGGKRPADKNSEDPTRANVKKAIQGLNWVMERAKENPGRRPIISMSIGTDNHLDFDKAVRAVIAQGIPVVASAGNGKENKETKEYEGVDASVRSPAHLESVITVGAINRHNVRLYRSNFGKVVDLYAPGEDVATASAVDNSASASSTGTSPAAAHVAGLVAVLSCHPHVGATVANPAAMHAKVIALSDQSKFNMNLGQVAIKADSHKRVAHLPAEIPA
ncbi:hypothetical protein CVT24_004226 [Panaeolus cyanescens]|uniref:Peptidase S8/S53 domain-containing protein n=1 Tax=Panaeolus cyanescens TaxID=181874 RepID=A0A409YSX9_9AGAR|nr:hypothetical protein CVT24_004226 [Panaeolus cyanescens]